MPDAWIPETPIIEGPNRLVRAIGRWSLAALMINIMIGSGIFGLPSALAGLLGRGSLLALLIGAIATGVIGACFSEVASYFTVAGGPYLYTRVAYGRFVGLQVGWMYWLVRLTAPAASANLFVVYLGEFWPWANDRMPRALILGVLIGGLALINCLGVKKAARISDVFTVAKLLPLIVVAIAGIAFLSVHPQVINTTMHAPHLREWLKASLLIVFAYGGFDAAITATSEIKNPRRDAAAALLAALAACTLLYLAVQWTALGTVPDLAHSSRPLTDSARIVFGHAGAVLIAVGTLISVFGNLSANTLAVPRITFALAEQGDFPSFFARVHPRFRTPYVSIYVFAFLVWAFALGGNFTWNATLSAIARLFYYAAVCAAVPVLRRKMPGAAQFRLPGAPWVAALGVVICAILFTQVDLGGSLILLATFVVATLNWQVVREKQPRPVTDL
jgi:APA family basic amino acid/polyamine antiporter